MLKLRWNALLLMFAACDSSVPAPEAEPSSQCGPAGTYAGYTGPKPWSAEVLATCEAQCPELAPESCLQDHCPGADAFFTCVDEELYACQTSKEGECRAQYEAYACCAQTQCTDVSESQVQRCLAESCTPQNDAVEGCYYPAAPTASFDRCVDRAYERCLQAEATPTPRDCAGEQADRKDGFRGERTWQRSFTKDDLAACETTCAGALSQATCVEEKCPGATQYLACLQEEQTACSTEVGGACRAEWERVFCCARDMCSESTGAAFDACLREACATPLKQVSDCGLKEPTATCEAHAVAACQVATDPDPNDDDAGVSGDPETNLSDAGTKERLLGFNAEPARTQRATFSGLLGNPYRVTRAKLQRPTPRLPLPARPSLQR